MAEAVRRLAEAGAELIGICGGFQMLGRSVADPHGLEGGTGSRSDDLGLLDLSTELAAEKTLIRRQGVHLPSGLPVRGYEEPDSGGVPACLRGWRCLRMRRRFRENLGQLPARHI
ncbi:MAG: hypothetical protein ACTFAK_15120 [Candidatus Electronema sp. VV]